MEGTDPPGSDVGHKAFWRAEKVHRSCDPEGSDRSAAADGGKRAADPEGLRGSAAPGGIYADGIGV